MIQRGTKEHKTSRLVESITVAHRNACTSVSLLKYAHITAFIKTTYKPQSNSYSIQICHNLHWQIYESMATWPTKVYLWGMQVQESLKWMVLKQTRQINHWENSIHWHYTLLARSTNESFLSTLHSMNTQINTSPPSFSLHLIENIECRCQFNTADNRAVCNQTVGALKCLPAQVAVSSFQKFTALKIPF